MSTRSTAAQPPSSRGGTPTKTYFPAKLGRAYYVYCAVDEPILRACAAYSSAPLSSAMSKQLDWIDSRIASGMHAEFGPRTCILTATQGHRCSVLILATFGGRSITEIDRLTSFYAYAVGRTPPWPVDDSPVVHTEPEWPEAPCYLIANRLWIDRSRIFKPYSAGSEKKPIQAKVAFLERLADVKEQERLHVPREQFKEWEEEWRKKKRDVDRLRKGRVAQQGGVQSAPLKFPTRSKVSKVTFCPLDAIVEEREPAPTSRKPKLDRTQVAHRKPQMAQTTLG